MKLSFVPTVLLGILARHACALTTFEEDETNTGTNWYLVNADTDEFVRYISDGEVIDHATVGTNLNICVDPLGDVASVEMTINGAAYPHHNIPPFCLAADEAGPPQTFDAVSEFTSTGTYTIAATPYPEDEKVGTPGATESITISFVDSIIAPEETVGSVTGWYLVNADTDAFINYVSEGDVIDHAIVGSNLNICVDTQGDVASLQMSINGRYPDHHNRPPFCLAADESRPTASFEGVPELSSMGVYTITATPYLEDELQGAAGGTETITLTVVDSAAPSSAPSPAPVESVFEPGSVSGWYLVNAATDQFLKYVSNGDQIDLAQVGSELNLCVDTQGDVASVLMVLNGAPFPHHNRPPFCLAADESRPTASFESVAEFRVPGTYTIAATPYSEDELQGNAGTMDQVTLLIVNSAFWPAETSSPTASPTTLQPTRRPTQKPTPQPTKAPTPSPTKQPTDQPTKAPTPNLTKQPTEAPVGFETVTSEPTKQPTPHPTAQPTKSPTHAPTPNPTLEPTPQPSKAPTESPTGFAVAETSSPTKKPTPQPMKAPTGWPTKAPTLSPTTQPTKAPVVSEMFTSEPSKQPTPHPTDQPTKSPTHAPTPNPTLTPTPPPTTSSEPSNAPSSTPSFEPSAMPTVSMIPSSQPSSAPSSEPTVSMIPSSQPSSAPSSEPTVSMMPSLAPSTEPSSSPSVSMMPSSPPSSAPSSAPSSTPSGTPSAVPTGVPSATPSAVPTSTPSSTPSSAPSSTPSGTPSASPTSVPSSSPTVILKETVDTAPPTLNPTGKPTTAPTKDPTVAPTLKPSLAPTSVPTGAPVLLEEVVGSITRWYLVNAETESFERYIYDGEIIDQRIDGKELNICINTKGDVGSVKMTINGRQPGYNNPSLFCLAAGDSNPDATFEAVPELSQYGTYTITATPFFAEELQGKAGEMQSIMVFVINTSAPSNAPSPIPSKAPTGSPTGFVPAQTSSPTASPTTLQPTKKPTPHPTPEPTKTPTHAPTPNPTLQPTPIPTEAPIVFEPVDTPSPTASPTTLQLTKEPTPHPTAEPTKAPTHAPTPNPTLNPTLVPTKSPVSFEPVGTVSKWYLVNAATDSFVRYLNDDETINLAVEGSELNVCVDTLGHVASVQMTINGEMPYGHHNIPPFCLAADEAGPPQTFDPALELAQPGTYSITATPFERDELQGDRGDPSTLSVTIFDSRLTPQPTKAPSMSPVAFEPVETPSPTGSPTTLQPTKPPTKAPTAAPTTQQPTPQPTPQPTKLPTAAPTKAPTGSPITPQPTKTPTAAPTGAPTGAPVLPEEIVGSITGWYLVNAASDTFIKYISNGEVIDHAMFGKDLNLCVDTTGDVGSVKMTINGQQPGYHNRAPFCLAADESRPTATFEGVPELAEYGTYSIVATPYFEDELQGEVGISESISVVVIDSGAPSSAPSPSPVAFEDADVGEISKWYLVNAATNSFVRYIAVGEVIYQSVDGTSLNICVDTLGDVASVAMSINGKTYPHHNIPPFCLEADEAGPPQTFDAVSELANTGTFSVTATPYSEDELGGITGASQTILFSIRDAPGRIRGRL